jgi:hypothetical protein
MDRVSFFVWQRTDTEAESFVGDENPRGVCRRTPTCLLSFSDICLTCGNFRHRNPSGPGTEPGSPAAPDTIQRPGGCREPCPKSLTQPCGNHCCRISWGGPSFSCSENREFTFRDCSFLETRRSPFPGGEVRKAVAADRCGILFAFFPVLGEHVFGRVRGCDPERLPVSEALEKASVPTCQGDPT